MQLALIDALSAALARLGVGQDTRLGVAVSGGSDSLALMHLAARVGSGAAGGLRVACVNHGLRPEAAAEAQKVAHQAAMLGLPFTCLEWNGKAAAGNLQAAARGARRELLAGWAGDHRLDAILLGHTADDQAETVLMRLARGSGVDGLAAMSGRFEHGGAVFLRPLLDVKRQQLRDWLSEHGLGWSDDPSNANPRFARTRARTLLQGGALPGLEAENGAQRLSRTARQMAQAREVLRRAAADLAGEVVRLHGGAVFLDETRWRAAPADTRLRLLAGVLCWRAQQPLRPRFEALEALADAGQGALHGCLLRRASGGWLEITRELGALPVSAPLPGDKALRVLWDGGHWLLEGQHSQPGPLEIRATGRHHQLRAPGLSSRQIAASPALWHGNTRVAVPLVASGTPPETGVWRVGMRKNGADLRSFLLSH